MRKTESTKSRIVLIELLEELKENVLDKKTEKVKELLGRVEAEYNYYKHLEE